MKPAAVGVVFLLVWASPVGGQGGGTVENEPPAIHGLGNHGTILHYSTLDVLRGEVLDRNGAEDVDTVRVEVTGDVSSSATGIVDDAVLDRRDDPDGTGLRLWDPTPGDGRISFALALQAPGTDANYTWRAWGEDEHGPGPVLDLKVRILNATPIANADIYVVSGDAPFTADRSSGVLANDKVFLEEEAQVVVEDVQGEGTLEVAPDGSLRFEPAAGFTDNVTFTYRIVQGGLSSQPVPVTLTIPGDAESVRYPSDCSIVGIALSRGASGIRFDPGDDTGCLTLVQTHPAHEGTQAIPLDMGGIAKFAPDGSREVQIGRLPLRMQRVDPAGASIVEVGFANGTVIRNSTQEWNGSFWMPTFEPVPPEAVGSGEQGTLAVRIGADARLDLDRPASIRFAQGAGQRVKVTHDDITWEEVTETCDAPGDPSVGGTPIAAGTASDDCKVDDGADLVVWTTHFSAYAVVASVVSSNGGGGGGGGGSAPSIPQDAPHDPAPSPDGTPGDGGAELPPLENGTGLPGGEGSRPDQANHAIDDLRSPASRGGLLWLVVLIAGIALIPLMDERMRVVAQDRVATWTRRALRYLARQGRRLREQTTTLRGHAAAWRERVAAWRRRD